MYVGRKVERDVAAKVRTLGIDGVSFVSEPKRYYPAGALAAPLLGFVGIDNNGLGGLENGFENTLAGKPGEMKVERDPQGRELPEGVQQGRSPERGSDLVLTVDQSLQYEVERVLSEEVTKTKSKGGMAVLADVETGDVLAMAIGRRRVRRRARAPRTGADAEPAAHRRLRAGLDEQGRDDRGRARGRPRRPEHDDAGTGRDHGRRPEVRGRPLAPARPLGRGHRALLVERRHDPDRAVCSARRASTRRCATSASASPPASTTPARRRASCCRSTSTTTRAWRRCRSAAASPSPRCRCSTCTSRSPTTAWRGPRAW